MIKLITILVRKPIDYDHLLLDQKAMITNFHTHPEPIKINSIVEISHEEFEDFKNDLLADRKFIAEQEGIFLVKEKGTDNYSGIIVDASGYEYARYAGIPMKEIDYKKCPRCGSFYTEHSAISRKDNKTEICPKCGVEEAFESFGLHKDFIDFLDNAHNIAEKYQVKIIIQRPDQDDITITLLKIKQTVQLKLST